MALLLIGRFRPNLNNFIQWITGYRGEIYVLTDENKKNLYYEAGYENVIAIRDFNNDILFERAVLNLNNHAKIEQIVPLDERDILRVSKLRSTLGIYGQQYESGLAYRNKLIMKNIITQNGLPTAAYARIDSYLTLENFINFHGFPVIVKPISGMATLNTFKINNDIEFYEYLDKIIINEMMVEKYIDLPMYTCDGVIINNQIKFMSVSKYFQARMKYKENLKMGLLMPDNPLSLRVKEACSKIINVLPTMYTGSFHAEFFVSDKEVMLVEIVSRTAGGRIDECIRQTYGIDLNKTVTQALAGCKIEYDFANKPVIDKITGSILIAKKAGKIKRMINHIPFEWVIEYSPRVSEGDVISDAMANGDIIASVVVSGESISQLSERFAIIEEYFEENLILF